MATVTFTSTNYSEGTCAFTPGNVDYPPTNLGSITFPFTFNPLNYSLPEDIIEGSFEFTTDDGCVFTKQVTRNVVGTSATTLATTLATSATGSGLGSGGGGGGYTVATTLATSATSATTLATTLATSATGSGLGSGGGGGSGLATLATTLATSATVATTQRTEATNATQAPVVTQATQATEAPTTQRTEATNATQAPVVTQATEATAATTINAATQAPTTQRTEATNATQYSITGANNIDEGDTQSYIFDGSTMAEGTTVHWELRNFGDVNGYLDFGNGGDLVTARTGEGQTTDNGSGGSQLEIVIEIAADSSDETHFNEHFRLIVWDSPQAPTQFHAGEFTGEYAQKTISINETSPTAATTLATSATVATTLATSATVATTQSTEATNATQAPVVTQATEATAATTINEPVPTFALTNNGPVNEGQDLIFTLTTTNIPNGTIVEFTTGGDATTNVDYTDNIPHGFTINNNTATWTVTTLTDNSFDGSTPESLIVFLNATDSLGNDTGSLDSQGRINDMDPEPTNATEATAATTEEAPSHTLATTKATNATTEATEATNATTEATEATNATTEATQATIAPPTEGTQGTQNATAMTLGTISTEATEATSATSATTEEAPSHTLATTKATNATNATTEATNATTEATEATNATTEATEATAATTEEAPSHTLATTENAFARNLRFDSCASENGPGNGKSINIDIYDWETWDLPEPNAGENATTLKHRTNYECYTYVGRTTSTDVVPVEGYRVDECRCEEE